MKNLVVMKSGEIKIIENVGRKIKKIALKDCNVCPTCGSIDIVCGLSEYTKPFMYKDSFGDTIEEKTFGAINAVQNGCKECGTRWVSMPYWIPDPLVPSKEGFEKNLWLAKNIMEGRINPRRFVYEESIDFTDLKGGAKLNEFYKIHCEGYGELIHFPDVSSDGLEKIFQRLSKRSEISGYKISFFKEDRMVYLCGNNEETRILDEIKNCLPINVPYTVWDVDVAYEELAQYADLDGEQGLNLQEYVDNTDGVFVEMHEMKDGELKETYANYVDPYTDSEFQKQLLRVTIEGKEVDVITWMEERITQDIKSGFCKVF